MKRFIRGLLQTIIMAEVITVLLLISLIATGATVIWANLPATFPIMLVPGWVFSRIFIALFWPKTHIMAFDGARKRLDTCIEAR